MRMLASTTVIQLERENLLGVSLTPNLETANGIQGMLHMAVVKKQALFAI